MFFLTRVRVVFVSLAVPPSAISVAEDRCMESAILFLVFGYAMDVAVRLCRESSRRFSFKTSSWSPREEHGEREAYGGST